MDEILALTEINFGVVFKGVIIVLVGFVSFVTLIEKVSLIIKKPVKWLKNRDNDHDLVIETSEELKKLKEKHEEDTHQSIRHDEMIREDIKVLAEKMDGVSTRLDVMQSKIDATEMAKLKEKILGYYRKYKDLGEWEHFEADVFWGLYDSYIAHGGNSFVKHDIEPVMRNLKFKD